jgi:hypothetical protein
MGTPRTCRAADPGPRPPRVPEHSRDHPQLRQRTETRQTRAGQATRVKEPPPRARRDVGKITKRELTLNAHRERAG